jgi:hypothetical protein
MFHIHIHNLHPKTHSSHYAFIKSTFLTFLQFLSFPIKLIKKIEGRFNARAYQIELRDEFMFTEQQHNRQGTKQASKQENAESKK